MEMVENFNNMDADALWAHSADTVRSTVLTAL